MNYETKNETVRLMEEPRTVTLDGLHRAFVNTQYDDRFIESIISYVGGICLFDASQLRSQWETEWIERHRQHR